MSVELIRNESNTNKTEIAKSVASSVDLCELQLGNAGSSNDNGCCLKCFKDHLEKKKGSLCLELTWTLGKQTKILSRIIDFEVLSLEL